VEIENPWKIVERLNAAIIDLKNENGGHKKENEELKKENDHLKKRKRN
jgi:hypothetical protein